jgi:hypothetical protein
VGFFGGGGGVAGRGKDDSSSTDQFHYSYFRLKLCKGAVEDCGESKSSAYFVIKTQYEFEGCVTTIKSSSGRCEWLSVADVYGSRNRLLQFRLPIDRILLI